MSEDGTISNLSDVDQEPDIVITDADLNAFAQQTQIVNGFFADPRPRPLAPTALVESKCVKTTKTYYLIFEQSGINAWILKRCLDDLPAMTSSGPAGATVQSDMVSGSIDWSALSTGKANCPHCSTQSLAKCGKCNRLSCHPDGQQGSLFICPWCGDRGYLRGSIVALDGRRGKDKKAETG